MPDNRGDGGMITLGIKRKHPTTLQHRWRIAENEQVAVLRTCIAGLSLLYGSVRGVGRALDIDHAYLSRLACGDKKNPSKEVLIKLDLWLPAVQPPER